jgi:hypothetical protein
MRIDRTDLLDRLRDFALSGHGVITGAAGVGKTVAVTQLTQRLLKEGRGVVLVGVADLGAATHDDIASALPHSGNLLDALAAIFAAHVSPGLLIVDGFDAAREPEVRERVLQFIRRLIRGADGRWHVVVTVRPYDAEKSPDLVALFPREGVVGARSGQIEIPLLTRKEVESATSPVAGFQSVVARAGQGLRELLRLPFNLWLVEQVLRTAGEGTVGDLSEIETETQLLERFWRARVSGGADGQARAELARRVAHAMATSQTLVVPASDVWSSEMSGPWDSLLSSEVLSLVGPAGSRVRFGHNILFDYATSLYVLSPDPATLRDYLTAVPSRALFLRPSLLFLFLNLWEYEREQFWRLFQGLAGSTELPVRLVSRLLPPYVLASEARSVAELRELQQPGWHDPVRVALWVLQGARFASGLRLPVWAEFVADLSLEPNPAYAWEAANLLRVILDRAEGSGDPGVIDAARSQVARGATSLLSYSLVHRNDGEGAGSWWDTLGARQALPTVIDTMDVEPDRAIDLIRSVLSLLSDPNVPIWYFFTLSQKIKRIVYYAPETAAEIYRAVFSHVETSEAPTALGGVVLRLRGTRRQDYEGAQYGLVQAYPEFVETAPVEAIRGGLYAGCLDVLRDGILRHVEPDKLDEFVAERTRPIVLGDATGHWLEDQSTLWPRAGRDDGVRLIAAAAKGVVRLAQDQDARLNDVLREYVQNASVSLAVARLLESGAEAPSRLAEPLRELALQRAIQTSLDLREALGHFLESAAPHLPPEALQELEVSILSIETDESTDLDTEHKTGLVDLLIGALPGQCLQTQPAKHRAAALEADGGAPRIEPPIRFQTSTSRFTQEDWLTEQGVDPESPPNRALRALLEPLKKFQEEWRNKRATAEATESIEEALWDAVRALDTTTADELVIREAWTAVAGAAATVARLESFSPSDSRWDRIRDLLVSALGKHPYSVAEDADESFTWPHWSPSPQTEAIQGLGSMLWKAEDPEVWDRIERIVLSERDPALRFLAASQLIGIYRANAKHYWDVAQAMAETEANPVVMATLLDGLGRLAWNHDAEVRQIMEVAWPRWKGTEHKEALKGIAGVLLVLVTHAEDPWAAEVLVEVRQEPVQYQELLGQILFQSAAALTPDSASDSTRTNIPRLRDVVSAGVVALKEADVGLRERQERGEDLSDERGSIHQLVDTVATRLDLNLRFDSGVQQEGRASVEMGSQPVIRAYFNLVWPVIERVLEFGEETGVLMAPTAHHLLELFNVVLKVDPATVLVAADRAVQAGRGDNYNLDSLAIREVVSLLETVLADHRNVLLGGPSMEAALSLLDTFAEAGWTEALELIWRLDEAFR